MLNHLAKLVKQGNQQKENELRENCLYIFKKLSKSYLGLTADEKNDIFNMSLAYSLCKWEIDKAKFSTFFYLVAKTNLNLKYNKNMKQKEINIAEVGLNKLDNTLDFSTQIDTDLEVRSILNKMLEEKSERDRKIILLYLKGYTRRETSNILHISVYRVHTTVTEFIQQAKIDLKDYI